MLREWARRWDTRIEEGIETPGSTLRSAWSSLVDQADSMCNVHSHVADRLIDEVRADISKWKKEHYTKSFLATEHRQTKQARTEFLAAQRPWNRLLRKVSKSKTAYYGACDTVDGLSKRLGEAERAHLENIDLEKLQAKLAQAKIRREEKKEAYRTWVAELQRDRPRYEQAMKKAFDHCQDVEQTRMDFFQSKLVKYHNIFPRDFTDILATLKESLDSVSADADLVAYADHYGTGMPLLCPQFVDYGEKEPVLVPHTATIIAPRVSTNTCAKYVEANAAAGYDEDWPAEEVPTEITGIRMRALYPYQAEEEGELTFEAGDEILQVEGEDEQGWCRGIGPAGIVGLYPASYVKQIEEKGEVGEEGEDFDQPEEQEEGD